MVRLLKAEAARAEEAIRPVIKAQPDNLRAKGLIGHQPAASGEDAGSCEVAGGAGGRPA